jgi:hypothetical protein
LNYFFKIIDDNVLSKSVIFKKCGSQEMGVPVVDIDGRIIIGFDRRLIEEALGLT